MARAVSIDGVLVRVRCFLVASTVPHYELYMTGRGESGIIDVRRERESHLPSEIEEAAMCFATSVRCRQEFPS